MKISEACLSGQMCVSKAGHRTGVGETNIRRWFSQYRTEGPHVLMPSERNRIYPADLNRRAVEEYLTGKVSLQDACEKCRICSDKQLRNCIKV